MPRQSVIYTARGAGAGFNLTAVSRAPIGADGSFLARVAPGVDLRRNATANMVDFQVWAVTDNQLGHWGFSRGLSANGRLRPAESGSITARVPGTSGGRSPAPIASRVLAGAPVAFLTTAPTRVASSTSGLAGVGWDCVHRGQVNGRRVVLGQIYHYSRGVRSRFSYVVGSSSTLGYGIRIGKALEFSQGGTVTRSSTARTSWRQRGRLSRTVYATQYDYGFYHCRAPTPPYERIIWEVMPNGYRAGASAWQTPHHPAAGYCTGSFERGSTFDIDREKNLTWSNGVSMKSAIGIDLSARSGYTTKVKVHFAFDRGGRHVCGTRGVPTQDPAGFVAVHT
jgi:hypothetical protein